MWSWEPHVNSGFMEPRASRGVCWGVGNGLDIGETLLGGGDSEAGITSGRHKKDPGLREPRSPALAQLPTPSTGPRPRWLERSPISSLAGPPDARVQPGLPSPADLCRSSPTQEWSGQFPSPGAGYPQTKRILFDSHMYINAVYF